MRSKTMTIMAAAVLFLPTIAHAQPSEGRGLYHRDDLKNARDDVRANRNVGDSGSKAAPLPRMTKPNDRAPTKRADTAQSNAPQPNGKATSEGRRLN
jgi:hypothetical protein